MTDTPPVGRAKKKAKMAKVFIFTSRPFQPKADLPRERRVKETLYLGGI